MLWRLTAGEWAGSIFMAGVFVGLPLVVADGMDNWWRVVPGIAFMVVGVIGLAVGWRALEAPSRLYPSIAVHVAGQFVLVLMSLWSLAPSTDPYCSQRGVVPRGFAWPYENLLDPVFYTPWVPLLLMLVAALAAAIAYWQEERSLAGWNASLVAIVPVAWYILEFAQGCTDAI